MLASLSRFVLRLPARMREHDKRQHIAWSCWLILAALAFMPMVAAFVLVLLIGLAKECWDHFYGSGFCLYDMLGNLLGSAFGLSIAFVFTSIARRGLVLL